MYYFLGAHCHGSSNDCIFWPHLSLLGCPVATLAGWHCTYHNHSDSFLPLIVILVHCLVMLQPIQQVHTVRVIEPKLVLHLSYLKY